MNIENFDKEILLRKHFGELLKKIFTEDEMLVEKYPFYGSSRQKMVAYGKHFIGNFNVYKVRSAEFVCNTCGMRDAVCKKLGIDFFNIDDRLFKLFKLDDELRVLVYRNDEEEMGLKWDDVVLCRKKKDGSVTISLCD